MEERSFNDCSGNRRSYSGAYVLSLVSLLLVASKAHSILPSRQETLLMDDFNEKKFKNRLGGGMGAWKSDSTDQSQWCIISYDDISFVGPTGSSLRVDYNIASNKTTYQAPGDNIVPSESGFHGSAFNGLYSSFEPRDVSGYRYLVFSAKGDMDKGFTRSFKLELQDGKRSAAIIFDEMSSRWKKFFISLDRFASAVDLKNLRAVVLVFDQNVTRTAGTFYVDDIFFAKSRDADLYRSLNPVLKIYKTDGSVKIDGNLKEWKNMEFLPLNAEKNLEMGMVNSEKDLSANACFQWDGDYLYFAVRVKDNELHCLKKGKELYQADSVELFIDPPAVDGLVWGNPIDYQLGFSPDGPEKKPQIWAWFQNMEPSPEEALYAAKVERDGYTVEAAISWKFLMERRGESGRVSPAIGKAIGISVAVNDLDMEDGTPRAKLNWYFVKDSKDSQKFQLGSFQLEGR